MCMNIMDYEPAEFLREELRRNRKPGRLCGECGREIGTGEVYEVVSGKWDGRLGREVTCAHCLKAREWLSDICGGWVYGLVFEDLAEHRGETAATFAWARLVVGMRRRWKRRDGALMPTSRLVTDAERRALVAHGG